MKNENKLLGGLSRVTVTVEIEHPLGFKELVYLKVIEGTELSTNKLDKETLINTDRQRTYENSRGELTQRRLL
ncbi:hypothetical protein CEXT_234451 [Caerostris extrusa]|uniref:Uncharacterized protein n=1 Tax=Caerostris extrusa TaxID=172846 RepID=A0AAV4YBC3_CAEEX|nr:hypothetical protein CEXT_234451 [Caerostris extrusa]